MYNLGHMTVIPNNYCTSYPHSLSPTTTDTSGFHKVVNHDKQLSLANDRYIIESLGNHELYSKTSPRILANYRRPFKFNQDVREMDLKNQISVVD